MAKRGLVWTRHSEIQLQEILEFYQNRNKINIYDNKNSANKFT
jgi:hypothetical protein